jgi:hypothetical protein
MEQKDLDMPPSAASSSDQSGAEHTSIVDYNQSTFGNQGGPVTDPCIPNAPFVDDEHTRTVTLGGGVTSDSIVGKEVVEFVSAQGGVL